jgi:hypothetical protein
MSRRARVKKIGLILILKILTLKRRKILTLNQRKIMPRILHGTKIRGRPEAEARSCAKQRKTCTRNRKNGQSREFSLFLFILEKKIVVQRFLPARSSEESKIDFGRKC